MPRDKGSLLPLYLSMTKYVALPSLRPLMPGLTRMNLVCGLWARTSTNVIPFFPPTDHKSGDNAQNTGPAKSSPHCHLFPLYMGAGLVLLSLNMPATRLLA